MQVYNLLTALLSTDLRSQTFINIFGDFNAPIGVGRAGDSTYLGHWGCGFRNVRGHVLICTWPVQMTMGTVGLANVLLMEIWSS